MDERAPPRDAIRQDWKSKCRRLALPDDLMPRWTEEQAVWAYPAIHAGMIRDGQGTHPSLRR